MEVTTRTISTDPGLLSVEELLAAQSKSQQNTLRQLAAQYTDGVEKSYGCRGRFRLVVTFFKAKSRWVLDKAGLKIKVR